MRIRKIIGMLAVGMLSLSLLAECGSTKKRREPRQKPQTKKQETADTRQKKNHGRNQGKGLWNHYSSPGSGACADYVKTL